MHDSLIAALQTLLNLQRWNFLPRVETWVEAENAAYVTHVSYALGRSLGLNNDQLEAILVRSAVKSLNKHYVTDISLSVQKKIRSIDPKVWGKLIDATADKTANLFPRKIAASMRGYLQHDATYLSREDREAVETIVSFAQQAVAEQECKTNAIIYSEYQAILDDITAGMQSQADQSKLARSCQDIWRDHAEYFDTIKRLKYLRRWNSINRMNPTSVLGHTLLVTLLAMLFAMLGKNEVGEKGHGLVREAMLRAVFHDVPESLTGDIITPVKTDIEKHAPGLVDQVEKALTADFIAIAPLAVAMDIHSMALLDELDTRTPYSVSSLVKDCDRLALVLECIYEKNAGVRLGDIENVYASYHQELVKSEWSAVREFMTIVSDHWQTVQRI